MAPAKSQRPRVGDTAWFVEWCSKLAFYDGDPDTIDRDSCKMSRRKVTSRDKALEVAKAAWPVAEHTFGFVEFWPAEFVAYDPEDAARFPHAGFWEATADGECYDGPPES